MSLNWVMLAQGGGFTRLPGESIIYTSPARTAFELKSIGSAQTGKQAFSRSCSAGVLYLTNRRIVYLPGVITSHVTQNFQSFASPILNLQDTRVTAPWFGANVWTALLQPVSGGGLPAAHPAYELSFTFKDGGAYDFHSAFERMKERTGQALELAHESGQMAQGSSGHGANALNVHLDDLPAYEAPSSSVRDALTTDGQRPTSLQQPTPARRAASPRPPIEATNSPEEGEEQFEPPADPPPGYEEVQSVAGASAPAFGITKSDAR